MRIREVLRKFRETHDLAADAVEAEQPGLVAGSLQGDDARGALYRSLAKYTGEIRNRAILEKCGHRQERAKSPLDLGDQPHRQ